jgi:hypothetical protein
MHALLFSNLVAISLQVQTTRQPLMRFVEATEMVGVAIANAVGGLKMECLVVIMKMRPRSLRDIMDGRKSRWSG